MKTRSINIWCRMLVGAFICALLMPAVGLAQDPKKAEKEAKENAKDEKRLDKTVRKYEEALAKANEKYNKDDEFRDDVDYEFKNLQREHARTAFKYNTFDQDDWVQTNSG